MRKAATFRLDVELLARARRRAREDNRSLTNLVETLLKSCVGDPPAPDHAELSADDGAAA